MHNDEGPEEEPEQAPQKDVKWNETVAAEAPLGRCELHYLLHASLCFGLAFLSRRRRVSHSGPSVSAAQGWNAQTIAGLLLSAAPRAEIRASCWPACKRKVEVTKRKKKTVCEPHLLT